MVKIEQHLQIERISADSLVRIRLARSSSKTEGTMGTRQAWEQILKVWACRAPRLQPTGEDTGHRQLTWPWRRELARSRRHRRQSWCPTLKVASSRGVTASTGSMEIGSRDDNRMCITPALHLASCPQLVPTGSKPVHSRDLAHHLGGKLVHLCQRACHCTGSPEIRLDLCSLRQTSRRVSARAMTRRPCMMLYLPPSPAPRPCAAIHAWP